VRVLVWSAKVAAVLVGFVAFVVVMVWSIGPVG